MPMDPNAKYGNTNPVANCADAFGVPGWVGFCTADVMIHGPREDHTQQAAKDWLIEHDLWPIQFGTQSHKFFDEMALICARAFPADRQ